jgi:transposase
MPGVFQNDFQEQQTMSIVPVYVGLDYHDDTIRVCVLDENGELVVSRNVPNDPGAVRDLIRCHGGLVRGVAIEACCGAADFATRLEEHTEWRLKLAHPAAVHCLKQGPDKTDEGDARLLAELLRVNYLPEVWLADAATRQLRRLVRYRQGLMAERKNIKLRIRSLLREERVSPCAHNAWTKPWTAWLTTVQLGAESQWILGEELRRLGQLDQDLERLEKRLIEATQGDAIVEKLLEQPGIGLVTAVILRAIVGRFDRFRTGKQLARYCGVTPRNASSGKRQADAGLVNEGNEILRAAVIQLAKRLPRHEPRWKEFHARMRRSKPANVATAAVANRWLRCLYHQMVPPRPLQPADDLGTSSANGVHPVAPRPHVVLGS